MKAWKVAFPTIRCPLMEIFWEDNVSSAALELLLTAFEGQNIRTFSLHGFPSVDADFITRVARAFPQLQKLSLMDQDGEGYGREWGASVRLCHVYRNLANKRY